MNSVCRKWSLKFVFQKFTMRANSRWSFKISFSPDILKCKLNKCYLNYLMLILQHIFIKYISISIVAMKNIVLKVQMHFIKINSICGKKYCLTLNPQRRFNKGNRWVSISYNVLLFSSFLQTNKLINAVKWPTSQ